jgi:predicted outer membrane repeat protein
MVVQPDNPTIAQTLETLLIYGKSGEGQYATVYLSSHNSRVVNILSSTICGGTSPNELLSAFSEIENATVVNLIYRPSNTVFGQIPWRNNWYPCATNWLDNETLVMRDVNDFYTIAAMFKLENNVMREVPVVLPPARSQPELPYADTADYQYIAPSNDYTKFVYLRCPPGVTDDFFCSDWVMYDTTLNQEIARLNDLFAPSFRGSDAWPGALRVYSNGYYAWSPNDRYFFYPSTSEEGYDDFRIYDTVTGQQLNTRELNWTLDLFRIPMWSPDSRYVAFWATGVSGFEGGGTDETRLINVFDTLTGQLVNTRSPAEATVAGYFAVELAHSQNRAIVWSPTTPELVVWDKYGQLFRVNVATGSVARIDTDVSAVFAWSIVEPIPTVDLTPLVTLTPIYTPTPSPTLTPTSTPLPPTCTATAANPAALVNAITAANANGASPDTICLAANATYTFATASDSIALPSVTTPITIVGNGAIIERASGAPQFRAFNVTATGSLTLQNLTIRNFSAAEDGGAIYLNGGSLTVSDSTFQSNSARYGAAVYASDGTIALTNVTMQSNSATEQGAGLFQQRGTVTVSGGLFDANSARFGAAIYVRGALSVSGTAFTNNVAVEEGAAIYNENGNPSAVTVAGSSFTGNTARFGGAIYTRARLNVTNSIFTNNTATESGGAVYHQNDNAQNGIAQSCFSGNMARFGGAVFSETGNFNAQNNWWGAATGPTGAMVNSNVQTSPYLAECPN